MTRAKYITGLLAVSALGLAGCSSELKTAQATVDAAEAALNQLQDKAELYAPDQLTQANALVTSLQERFEGRDRGAVAEVPRLNDLVEEIRETTSAREAEDQAEYAALLPEVDEAVVAIQENVDQLSASGKLPKGLNAANFDFLKEDVAQMQAELAAARSANEAGKALEALTAARTAQMRAQTLGRQLGL